MDRDFEIVDVERNKVKQQSNYRMTARVRDHEVEWTGLMRSAVEGDSVAYHRLLRAVTPDCGQPRGEVWHGPGSRSISARTSCRTFCWRCI